MHIICIEVGLKEMQLEYDIFNKEKLLYNLFGATQQNVLTSILVTLHLQLCRRNETVI